jgi:hypothetical protein
MSELALKFQENERMLLKGIAANKQQSPPNVKPQQRQQISPNALRNDPKQQQQSAPMNGGKSTSFIQKEVDTSLVSVARPNEQHRPR